MSESLENVYRVHRQGLFSFAVSLTGSAPQAEDAIQIAFAKLFQSPVKALAAMSGQLNEAADSPGPAVQEHSDPANGRCDPANGRCDPALVAYVFKSVRNSAIDICRADQRQKKISSALFAEHNPEATLTPPDELLTKERDAILRAAIEQLNAVDREAIVLKLFAGLTFEQAGQVAGTSPKTIATRYRRALKKLETQLKGQL